MKYQRIYLTKTASSFLPAVMDAVDIKIPKYFSKVQVFSDILYHMKAVHWKVHTVIASILSK